MSMPETTDTDKLRARFMSNPQIIECTDARCLEATHTVDTADDEDEAFHTAYCKDGGLWSVRVTRFESNNWVLDIETDAAIGVIFAQNLVDSITEAIALTGQLNADRNGGE